MDHIQLFELFLSEENSKIYDADYSDKKELIKTIVKTWVNDYVIPMIDYQQGHLKISANKISKDTNLKNLEKDPKYKAFVSKAKAWLKKSSGVEKYLNSDIVYLNLYNPRELFNEYGFKTSHPITTSFYADFYKGDDSKIFYDAEP